MESIDPCGNAELIRLLQQTFGSNDKFYDNAMASNNCRSHGNTANNTSTIHEDPDQNFLDLLEYLEDENDSSRDVIMDICAYVTPVIIVIGILGNMTSLFVFLSRRLRGLSASHYLAALSASDTVVLSTYVFMEWLNKGLPRLPGHHRIGIININGLCQIFLFISYTFRFVSVYLIIVFTIERYIAVCKPLQRRMICTRNFAKKLILVVVALGAAISLPKPLLSGIYKPHHYYTSDSQLATQPEVIDSQGQTKGHDLDEGHGSIFTGLMDTAQHNKFADDTFLDFFNPNGDKNHNNNRSQDTTATLQTAVLAGKFDDSPQQQQAMIHSDAVCMRNPRYDNVNIVLEVIYGMLIIAIPFLLLAFFNMLIMRRLIRRFRATHKLDISFRENRIRWEFSVMLLVVSSCFILLNIPYCIVWIRQYQYSIQPPSDPATIHTLSRAIYVAKTIFYLNYGINFFLYCLTGPYYRSVIRDWFYCLRHRGGSINRRGGGGHFANGGFYASASMRKFSQSASMSTQGTYV